MAINSGDDWGTIRDQLNAILASTASDLAAAQAAREGAEAAQAAAENVNVDVDDALTAANAARDKAAQWAEEATDVEVETGQYSAKHHSEKSGEQRALAEIAKTAAETARDAAFINADVYADTAAGLAATSVGDQFQIVSGSQIIRYRHDAGPVAVEVVRFSFVETYLTPMKNLFDKATMARRGRYYSPGSGAIISSASCRATDFIPVTEGEFYAISGAEPGMICIFADEASDTAAFSGQRTLSDGSGIVQVPTGYPFLVVNITDGGQDVTTYDDTLQIERGGEVTAYAAYEFALDPNKIAGGQQWPVLVSEPGVNLIDPSKINYAQRYSTGSLGFVTDVEGIAASDWIEVTPGETYTVSGERYTGGGGQGGYFTSYGAASATANITWFDPPNLEGKSFTVPEGLGVTHVVISLRKLDDNPASTELHGPVQAQRGEVATPILPYETRRVISEANLPLSLQGSTGAASVTLNANSWLKYVGGESQPYLRDKWPVFTQKMLRKDADVTVVSVGTSLTARSTEHHSDHPDAATRPPLMHSLNEATYIWDALSRGWEGQQYRRYDAASGVSETSGTWATSHNLAEWDDGAYRNGLTRYSATNGAAVAFTVPAGTWAFGFIHRTDSVASTALSVAISGGNNIAQVWNGSTWVEANGYTFSQREAAPVTRSVLIPNPDTDVFAAGTIATKGNTTYQKRLRLRFINRTAERTVTITNTDDGTRFNYWGCEWSQREFMLTYVNAARGSFNTQATQTTGLPRVADNEVHSFKPDLIYGELPIHNDGAAGVNVYATWDRWGRLANNYVWRADYELSLKTRASFYGYTPEFGWWTPSIAYGFSGISEDGQLLSSAQTDGVVMTALDKFDQAAAWIKDEHPEAVFIHAVRRWVEAGFAIYGDLKTATQASTKTGPSMTNDGGHSNDVGAKVLAKLLVGPLDFAS